MHAVNVVAADGNRHEGGALAVSAQEREAAASYVRFG
jgi:hypothetical protein